MASIDAELNTIATSVYGSEMRSAIHDAIEKVNNGSLDRHITQTVTGEVTSGASTLYLYSITFHSLIPHSATVANDIVTVDAVISVVNGRSGYPLGPGIEDDGVVVCTIPDEFWPTYDFKLPVVPMGTADIDLPHLYFDATNQQIRFVNGFSEILGDITNMMSHGTYFVTSG